MKYKIIVDKQPSTNPTTEKREYEVDIEELRVKGNVYDSLIITKDEAYVLRRLSLSELQVLTVLENEVKEPLTDLDMTLFEGDNYIYLIDLTGNKFYAEYLVKNGFNDIFCTRNEMNAAIVESAGKIELSVNQKLTGYSTTEETNAIITALANSINLEVSKKVNNETLTGANILLRINNDESEAKINADKIDIDGKAVRFTTNIKTDYKYTSADLTKIQNYLSGTGTLTAQEMDLYDIDGDGVINSSDMYDIIVFINKNQGINNGTFQIDPYSAKRCIVLKDYNGDISTYVGLHGIKSPSITGDNCDFKSIVLEDSEGKTYISTTEIRTPKLTQTSLEKDKKNFEKLENALDILNNIDIYKYNLKNEDDETKKHIGFVIGENYKYSEEVTSDENNGVDLYSFASLCCKAIQEQQEKIDKLEKRLEALENG